MNIVGKWGNLIGVTLAIMFIGLGIFVGYFHLKSVKQKNTEKKRVAEEKETIAQFRKGIEAVDNEDDLNFLSKNLKKLPVNIQAEIESILSLKKVVFLFENGEYYLEKARNLFIATATDEVNPIVLNYFNQAKYFYREAKVAIDQLNEIEDDSEYNHCLYYTRGEIYYRILQSIATNEEKPEIFNQTVAAYKKALLLKPRDIDTEINVEILRINRGSLMNNANIPTSQLLRQLPQQGIGTGSRKGKY